VKKQVVEKKEVVKKPAEKTPKIETKPKIEKKEPPKPKPSTTESEKKNRAVQQEAEKKSQQEAAAAQEVVRQKQQAQLAKTKENLSKLSESRGKVNSSASASPSLNLATTNLPQEVKSLQIDALPNGGVIGSLTGERGGKEGGVREVNYRDKIAAHLKKALKLPEYGEVTVKLTLDRSGKVVKVESVKSESTKNKAFIERALPTLVLPPFGKEFSDLSQQTFLITLENDS
jgi:outer membrane biosynthesis protein TonB